MEEPQALDLLIEVPGLHLFAQKCSQNSNIVKYYYNSKQQFST